MLPLFHYSLSDPTSQKLETRSVTVQGRTGQNPLSVHQRFTFPAHTLNLPKGTFTFWLLSLEDTSTTCTPPSMGMSNPNNGLRSFLSDSAQLTDPDSSQFSLEWQDYWQTGLLVRHYPGSFYPDAFRHRYRAVCKSVGFTWQRYQWNQFTYTWDHPSGEMYLYVNGVRVGSSDRMTRHYEVDQAGDMLYSGGIPSMVYSDLSFYDQYVPADVVAEMYRSEVIEEDMGYNRSLALHYAGVGNPDFSFVPGSDWKQTIDLPLSQPENLSSFYLQGHRQAVTSTPEGLHVQTPTFTYWQVVTEPDLTEKQVYLWLLPWLEGDLYVEFDFQPVQEGGLMLFMAQCSGFWGEDFMADYPRKTSGKMTTVFGEDVRNYHWECWRDMNDTRNDVCSHGLIKQPYGIPLAHGTQAAPTRLGEWNRLQFLQQGEEIRGAINGEEVFHAHDRSFSGTGTCLNRGHLAIRCMVNTNLFLRNLKVWNLKNPC